MFYDAFTDLIGDRSWEFGPITWEARRLWAKEHGLDRVATALLHTHVSALDLAFLKWKSDSAKSRAKEQESQTDGKPA